MRRPRLLMVIVMIALVGSLATVGWVQAKSGKAPVLTTQDYLDIAQVYSICYQGSDLRDAAQWLSAFADDALFTLPNGDRVTGKKALAEWRAKSFAGKTGDSKRRHWFGTLLTKPTPDGGATVRAYYVVLDVSGKQSAINSSGMVDDVFVKTADGWKFKTHVVRGDGGE
jgi:hypothetical protein